MPLTLIQQLETHRLQGLQSSTSLNRYKLKQLQSLVPKCWNQIKHLDDKFNECSTLFECPNLDQLVDSNGFHDTQSKNVNYMTPSQLSETDKLIILFLDLSLPYNNKVEVQTLVWYLFYFYRSSVRLSVYFLYYIIPVHSTSIYSDFITNLTFPPNSSFSFYKANTTPSREWITNTTLRNFENYKVLSQQARRLSLEVDRDSQNPNFFSFFNSIQIELFNQTSRLTDNQLRFFLYNALEAFKHPDKHNYYNTYLCGVSALLSKYNLTKQIQSELVNTFLSQFINKPDHINNEVTLQTIIFVSLFQYQQDELKYLSHKWFNYLISNREYQNVLVESIKELAKSDIDVVRFCQLLLQTAISIESPDDNFIEITSELFVKIISIFENKQEKSAPLLSTQHFENLSSSKLLIRIRSKLGSTTLILEKQNEVKKRKISPFAYDNISVLLERFENWNNSTESHETLLKISKELLQLFPRYYSEILKSTSFWQFISGLDDNHEYFIALTEILSNILNKVDDSINECLSSFLLGTGGDKLNSNDYLFFEYALQPFQDEFFSCIDYIIHLSRDQIELCNRLCPLAITLGKISSFTTNSNLLARIDNILNSLTSINALKDWPDVLTDTFKSESTFRSINVLLEYIRYLSKNDISDPDSVLIVVWDYLRRLDPVVKLIRSHKVTDYSTPFISVLSSFIQIFCSSIESQSIALSEKLVSTLIILDCQNDFLRVNLPGRITSGYSLKIFKLIPKNVVDSAEPPIQSSEILDVDKYSIEELVDMTIALLPLETLYKKLLRFIILDVEPLSFSLILLFYLIPGNAQNATLYKAVADFISNKLKKKSNLDISQSMDLLVTSGFLLSNPCERGYRLPKSDVTTFLQSILNYNYNNINWYKNLKELLKGNKKVGDTIFYLSHYIPREDSKSFRSLINLSNVNSTSSFNLITTLRSEDLDLLYNTFSGISDLYTEKAKRGNLPSAFIKRVLSSLIESRENQEVYYLVSDAILTGDKYYDTVFNLIYKLISDAYANSVHLAPLLISLSDKCNLNPSSLIGDLEKSDGVLRSILYLVLLRSVEEEEEVKLKLIEMLLEDKLDHGTYYMEILVLFFNISLSWSSSVPIARLLLSNLRRLDELSMTMPGDYFDSSTLVKSALSILVSFPALGSDRSEYRQALRVAALSFWNNCPDALVSRECGAVEIVDYFIHAKRILTLGDYSAFNKLESDSKLHALIALSTLLLEVKFDNLSVHCDKFALLIQNSLKTDLFAISSSPQVDCTTAEYKKVGHLGDLLFYIFSLFDITNHNGLKKALWSILGNMKLHLNLPHLILSTLGYPFHYDLQCSSIKVNNSNISILLQLFKMLTNIFKNASLAVTSLDGLKLSEIKNLYTRIIFILTQLFPENPHIILKSLIFLVKTGCSTVNSLQSMVFPLFITSELGGFTNTDINLLSKLVVFSSSIPGIDVIFHEFGDKLFRRLIGLLRDGRELRAHIGEPLAIISNYIAIPTEIYKDVYQIALESEFKVKDPLLRSLSKSISRKHITELAKTARDSAEVCSFFMLAGYFSANTDKLEAKMGVLKNVLKVVVDSTPLDSGYSIDGHNLREILKEIVNNDDTFSVYYSRLNEYLLSLIKDFSITQISTLLEQVKLTCVAAGKGDNELLSIYRQLYLCLGSSIIIKLEKSHKPQDYDVFWIPLLQQILKVFESEDVNVYILSLSIIEAAATISVTYKLYEQLIEVFFASLKINMGMVGMRLWEAILARLITNENYDVVSKRLRGEITLGDSKLKKILVSLLINICNGAKNESYDVCICEKLKSNLISIKSSIKDITYDSDRMISKLAKELYDNIQELVEYHEE